MVDGLTLKEKVMFLLYATDNNIDKKLYEIIEYKNFSYFKKLLNQLHTDRFLEYKIDGVIVISPKGVAYAEDLITTKVSPL